MISVTGSRLDFHTESSTQKSRQKNQVKFDFSLCKRNCKGKKNEWLEEAGLITRVSKLNSANFSTLSQPLSPKIPCEGGNKCSASNSTVKIAGDKHMGYANYVSGDAEKVVQDVRELVNRLARRRLSVSI